MFSLIEQDSLDFLTNGRLHKDQGPGAALGSRGTVVVAQHLSASMKGVNLNPMADFNNLANSELAPRGRGRAGYRRHGAGKAKHAASGGCRWCDWLVRVRPPGSIVGPGPDVRRSTS